MIPRYAEYGSQLIQADILASIRGSGNFDYPPIHPQTVNRGNAWQNAALEQVNNNTNYPPPNTFSPGSNNNGFYVGSTSFYNENPNTSGCNTTDELDAFQKYGLKSTKLVLTPLLLFFFSKDNVINLMNDLKDHIFKISSVQIADQSYDELLIIMRNKFIYGIQGALPANDQGVVSRGPIYGPNGQAYTQNNYNSLYAQLKNLNTAVLQEIVQQTLSGINAYKQYYKDISSMPLPMEQPVMTSMKGSKSLQQNIGLYDGDGKFSSSFNERYNIL